jgi:hypothetical protein
MKVTNTARYIAIGPDKYNDMKDFRFYQKEDLRYCDDNVIASINVYGDLSIPGSFNIDMIHDESIGPVVKVIAYSDTLSILKHFSDLFDRIEEFQDKCEVDKFLERKVITMDDIYKILDELRIIAVETTGISAPY